VKRAAQAVLTGLVVSVGCTGAGGVPSPDSTVAAYAEALRSGDSEALHEMMSDESRRAVSRRDLDRVLSDQRRELREHADAVTSSERVTTARADLRYDDGESVSLDLEDGAFRITSADALPAAARTPTQALGQLRRVLARRSYAGLLRVLSPRTRAAVERDMRSIVEGLNDPGSLHVDIVGDAATVSLPGGHEVRLRREDGVWHVDDFN
jgi:hypothetical protein